MSADNSVRRRPINPSQFQVDCTPECNSTCLGLYCVPCCGIDTLYDESIEPAHGKGGALDGGDTEEFEAYKSSSNRGFVTCLSFFLNFLGLAAIMYVSFLACNDGRVPLSELRHITLPVSALAQYGYTVNPSSGSGSGHVDVVARTKREDLLQSQLMTRTAGTAHQSLTDTLRVPHKTVTVDGIPGFWRAALGEQASRQQELIVYKDKHNAEADDVGGELVDVPMYVLVWKHGEMYPDPRPDVVPAGGEQPLALRASNFVSFALSVLMFYYCYLRFKDIFGYDAERSLKFCDHSCSCGRDGPAPCLCLWFCTICWLTKLVKHAEKHGGSRGAGSRSGERTGIVGEPVIAAGNNVQVRSTQFNYGSAPRN